MLRINHGQLTVAMSAGPVPYPTTGYLNRNTGQVIHVLDDASQADDPNAAPDDYVNYLEVESDPAAWIEIPKYHGPDTGHEQFIEDFLIEAGIDNYIID